MDTVRLEVDNKRIERFKSYTIDADVYVPDDAFTLEFADPEIEIKAGMPCALYVNDQREMTGVIDLVAPQYSKSGESLSVTGRSLMGWCVDASAEKFHTLEGYTLKRLAEEQLEKCPYVDLKNIQYAENVRGRLKGKNAQVGIFDTTSPLSQPEPGMSVYDVLSQYAKSKGMLFYDMPDGTFVFGRPTATGEIKFRLINRRDGRGNNIISARLMDDISKGYSKVTIIGQKQADPFKANVTASDYNVEATRTDTTPPFDKYYKPKVIKDEYGGENPALHARLAIEKMRHERFRLQYAVAGHSQDNKNWSINVLAQVEDEARNFKLNRPLLIYGRTFCLSKDRPAETQLRLGLPGMIA